MKGSDLLVKALENEGVERIFGVPGEENLDVVESLHGSKIELIVTRHEQAAAFMASGLFSSPYRQSVPGHSNNIAFES
jgi:acetolactate synthase-1/2/3 large subunit